jgi:hypothetical protein
MTKTTTRTADRYIGRNGEPPLHTRSVEDLAHERIEDLTAVAIFLASCPPNEMWGGWRCSEALEAFARLIDVPVAKLRGLA